MYLAKLLVAVVTPLVLIAVLGVGWATKSTWQGWLSPTKDDATPDAHAHGSERVKLSEQAKKNLRLVVKELALTKVHWRKITLPGTVVDRPGHSDRGIPAPIAGVVTHVFAVPGKSIKAGDELFRIRIASESFQASQMELFKSTRELQIAKKEHKRLESIPSAVPATRLLELEYQQDRLNVLIQAHTQDLKTRHLTAEQIKDIENGTFVTEVVIRMPERVGKLHAHSAEHTDAKEKHVAYEVQELKVNLGDHVQAGQILAYIADHRFLYIEGRALKQEITVLNRAMRNNLPVEAEFNSGDDDTPAERLRGDVRFDLLGDALPLPIYVPLRIEFLGNTMDATGLTLPVYVPFENKERRVQHLETIHRFGPARPGQKVLLKVAVAQMKDVFVLPVDAVVREGPEAYVFKQSGDSFIRRAVHVLAEDADEAVIANDDSISGGQWIAHNAAAALNRALKASQSEGGGGHHHHH